MSNIVQLPMELQMGDFKTSFNAAVVKGKSGLLLIDCGLPGFLPKLEQAMADNGLSLSDVKKIVITHHDADHMGALKALLDKYPGIEVAVLAGPGAVCHRQGEAAAADDFRKALRSIDRRGGKEVPGRRDTRTQGTGDRRERHRDKRRQLSARL